MFSWLFFIFFVEIINKNLVVLYEYVMFTLQFISFGAILINL